MGKSRRTPRKNVSSLHKEAQRRARDDARRESQGASVTLRRNWDGSISGVTGGGQINEVFAKVGEAPKPGEHAWVVMISYDVHDLLDRYDARATGGGLGILGPERIITLTPPICSECASAYTPEERNTRCSGVVPS